MTLTEFLLARIAEDEAVAEAGGGAPVYPHFGDTAAEECVEMARSEGCADAGVEYLRRWPPARVLAECEAKRRIVGEHARTASGNCVTCDPGDAWEGAVPDPCPTLRALATVYAAHPDYRHEWGPDRAGA